MEFGSVGCQVESRRMHRRDIARVHFHVHLHLVSTPMATHLVDDFLDNLIPRRECFPSFAFDANRRAADEVAPGERGCVELRDAARAPLWR